MGIALRVHQARAKLAVKIVVYPLDRLRLAGGCELTNRGLLVGDCESVPEPRTFALASYPLRTWGCSLWSKDSSAKHRLR